MCPPLQSQSTSTTRREPVNEYLFPIKRFVLTRNPKDTSMESNGIGLKVIGGREMPDSTGRLACYIAKIFPEKLAHSAPPLHVGKILRFSILILCRCRCRCREQFKSFSLTISA